VLSRYLRAAPIAARVREIKLDAARHACANLMQGIPVAVIAARIEWNPGWSNVEPMTGIEPAYSAWEADVLPLNYIGDVVWEG